MKTREPREGTCEPFLESPECVCSADCMHGGLKKRTFFFMHACILRDNLHDGLRTNLANATHAESKSAPQEAGQRIDNGRRKGASRRRDGLLARQLLHHISLKRQVITSSLDCRSSGGKGHRDVWLRCECDISRTKRVRPRRHIQQQRGGEIGLFFCFF